MKYNDEILLEENFFFVKPLLWQKLVRQMYFFSAT